jgi:hypothetical protein
MDACTEIQPALASVAPNAHRAACLAVETVAERPLNAAAN